MIGTAADVLATLNANPIDSTSITADAKTSGITITDDIALPPIRLHRHSTTRSPKIKIEEQSISGSKSKFAFLTAHAN
ncbi:hypothetical protein AWC22_26420 [Mycobacterium riyadhense]|uniref:Uncharacterized protein n=1 Tax=Mycobacterium riyadhense TaxID=486698 RepID=A0A1X2BYM4_9MYCO|nr:hypothetical protein AWC22_26420 [Mycobacterium riyadhense]